MDLERFFRSPEERQNSIIDAALKAFGINGYKKTSVSDIAAEAGISKAMVFHYFGTKKALYLYLVELCGRTMMAEIDRHFDTSVTDFFDRMKISSNIEFSVMKQHAAMPAFLASMYFENDEEVKADIKNIIDGGEDFRNRIVLEGVDVSKFKDTVNLKSLIRMLQWIADGFTKQLNVSEPDFDKFEKEFDECLDMLRNNFYKEEYVG